MGDAKTQSADVPLIYHLYLLQIDISASDLMKLGDSRTKKPVMVVIRDYGGNQYFQTVVQGPENTNTIFTPKTRCR